jgi:hypothetical protein
MLGIAIVLVLVVLVVSGRLRVTARDLDAS